MSTLPDAPWPADDDVLRAVEAFLAGILPAPIDAAAYKASFADETRRAALLDLTGQAMRATSAGREISRLKAWVADLQSGMYVNCVYCGHRYGPGETTPVSMADALKAHVVQCPQHPMSGLLKAAEAASSALKSYQYGNAAPDLAKGVAEFVDAAIAEARKT